MNPHIVPRFGLPYATVDIAADGSVAHVCPVCGERIPESTDADGEVVTNNYAVHFIQRAEADGTIPPEPPTTDDYCAYEADAHHGHLKWVQVRNRHGKLVDMPHFCCAHHYDEIGASLRSKGADLVEVPR